MINFMDDAIFLKNDTAKRIYNTFAKDLPIIDYHCHLKSKDIYEDKKYENITQIWLASDHYKWRLMRANGIEEKYITGDASDKDKFKYWAKTIERAVGNPLYHWTHMELKRYFGITVPLNGRNYEQIWEKCNFVIQEKKMSPRYFISEALVRIVGTTDDPYSNLEYHKKLNEQGNLFEVIPTMRVDSLVKINNDYINYLENEYILQLDNFEAYLEQIFIRMDYFDKHNCRSIDLGIERLITFESKGDCDKAFKKIRHGDLLSVEEKNNLQTEIIIQIASRAAELGWVFQFHIGAEGSINEKAKNKLGVGKGFDTILEQPDISTPLINMLNRLNQYDKLPKMIFYNIDGTKNSNIETIIACFQGNNEKIKSKLQHGPAWWFQDTFRGNIKQLKDLAEQGILMNFIGMTTDSRSYLSYVRHDYFRRILCSCIGEWIEDGELPNDDSYINNLIVSIGYKNALKYFNIS